MWTRMWSTMVLAAWIIAFGVANLAAEEVSLTDLESAEIVDAQVVSDCGMEKDGCGKSGCGSLGSGCSQCCLPWKGFYVGGHTGYAWSELIYTEGPGMFGGPDAIPFGLEGAIGGVHLGYNWQTGNIVYGLEADWK